MNSADGHFGPSVIYTNPIQKLSREMQRMKILSKSPPGDKHLIMGQRFHLCKCASGVWKRVYSEHHMPVLAPEDVAGLIVQHLTKYNLAARIEGYLAARGCLFSRVPDHDILFTTSAPSFHTCGHHFIFPVSRAAWRCAAYSWEGDVLPTIPVRSSGVLKIIREYLFEYYLTISDCFNFTGPLLNREDSQPVPRYAALLQPNSFEEVD